MKYTVFYGWDKLKSYTGTVNQIMSIYGRLLTDRDSFQLEIYCRETGEFIYIPMMEHRAFNGKRIRGCAQPVKTNIGNLIINR